MMIASGAEELLGSCENGGALVAVVSTPNRY
jgi:hypothetical protein